MEMTGRNAGRMTREEAAKLDRVQQLCAEAPEEKSAILSLAASGWTEAQVRDCVETYGPES